MGNKIGVLVAQRLDVPNFVKDVPNFIKDIPNFVNNVPSGPTSVLKWETTSNHFPKILKGMNGP